MCTFPPFFLFLLMWGPRRSLIGQSPHCGGIRGHELGHTGPKVGRPTGLRTPGQIPCGMAGRMVRLRLCHYTAAIEPNCRTDRVGSSRWILISPAFVRVLAPRVLRPVTGWHDAPHSLRVAFQRVVPDSKSDDDHVSANRNLCQDKRMTTFPSPFFVTKGFSACSSVQERQAADMPRGKSRLVFSNNSRTISRMMSSTAGLRVG